MSDSDSDDDYTESDAGSTAVSSSPGRQLNIYRLENRNHLTFLTTMLHCAPFSAPAELHTLTF